MNPGHDADNGGHPVEELPALVEGTLALDEIRRLTAHLRGCDECRRALIEIVGATAALHIVRDVDEASDGLPPLAIGQLTPVQPADTAASRRSSRRWPVIAGGIAAAVAIALVVSFLLVRRSSPSTVAVALQPVGASGDRGSVSMTSSGADRTMTVDAQLRPPEGGSFYEVWLLDQATGRMLSVGVLPPDGKAAFSLPAELVAGYDVVDVSLEPDDGVAAHSTDSVLRARYRPAS